MKILQNGLVALAVIASMPVFAQQKGDMVFQIGYLHVSTFDGAGSKPLHTELRPSLLGSVLGIDQTFDSPGTSVSVGDGQTLAITSAYFVTDNLSVKLDGGIPIRFFIRGEGTVAPTGPTGRLFNVNLGDSESNPIASAKQWTPAVILQYKFLDNSYPVRPFLGVGFSYTWFTEVDVNNRFEDQLNQRLGRALALAAGKPGATTVHTDATQSFDPVVNLGLTVKISEHFGISFSQSFAPISTVASVDINAADGTQLSHSTVRIQTNTYATALLLDYKFGGFKLSSLGL